MSVIVVSRDPSRRARVAQLVRYGTVSAIATTTSLVVLGVLVGGFDAPAAWSNVIATAIGTVPSFELNRRWVWGRRGRRSVGAEIAPFCLLSFSGLVLSTLAVHAAATATTTWSRTTHTAAVELANVAAFGSLWVLQFVLLDRVLFRRRGLPTRPMSSVRVRATAGCADRAPARDDEEREGGLHTDAREADPGPDAA